MLPVRSNRTFRKGLSGAIQTTSFKLPSAEYAVAGSIRAWDIIPSPTATNFPKTNPLIRPRSRSDESRLRQQNRSRRIDPEVWRQMSEKFVPRGFCPKDPNLSVANNPPQSTVFEDKQVEPGLVRICPKSGVGFPKQNLLDAEELTPITHSKYVPGATFFSSLRSKKFPMLGRYRYRSEQKFNELRISTGDR